MEFILKIVFKIILTIVITVFLFSSCDDTITVVDVDNRIIPDSNVSYLNHIVPVLQAKCYFCHDGGSSSHSPNLMLYTEIVDGRIVVPTQPETSVLIWTVEARAGFPEMPPLGTAPPLTENQLKGFRTWISEGALNN